MSTSLKGQVAWITGGGSGIGLAGAIELVKAGAHVVISGRNAATNATALAQLQSLGSAEAVLLDQVIAAVLALPGWPVPVRRAWRLGFGSHY